MGISNLKTYSPQHQKYMSIVLHFGRQSLLTLRTGAAGKSSSLKPRFYLCNVERLLTVIICPSSTCQQYESHTRNRILKKYFDTNWPPMPWTHIKTYFPRTVILHLQQLRRCDSCCWTVKYCNHPVDEVMSFMKTICISSTLPHSHLNENLVMDFRNNEI